MTPIAIASRRRPSAPTAATAIAIAVGVIGCATPDFLVGESNTRPHEFALEEALKESDGVKLRELCREVQTFDPPGIYSLVLRPWPNTKVQQQACDEVHAKFEKTVQASSAKAKAAGGAACIEQLQQTFSLTSHSTAFEWETDEARRESLSPAVESCIAAAEADVAAGKYPQVALAFQAKGAVADYAVLTDAHQARLATLIPAARAGAIAAWGAQAKAKADTPLVAALYMSAQSAVARRAGDATVAEGFATSAAATMSLMDSDAMRIAVSGSGLGAEVAERLKAMKFDGDVVWDDRAKDTIVLTLTEPKINTNTGTTELSAEYKVERGTRTNPEWTSKDKECTTTKSFMNQEESSCERHGSSKNVACGQAVASREKLNRCIEKRDAIKKDVPAYAMEKARYSATEYTGSARGDLGVDGTTFGKKRLSVDASERRYTHDALAIAKVSSTTSKPVTSDEMQRAYRGSASSVIGNEIRSRIAAKRASLLKTAMGSDDMDDVAASIAAYGLRESPKRDKLDPIDARLHIPTYEAITILRANK